MPAIEARGLERTFGDVRAVAGVDLDVAEGEIYAFLGSYLLAEAVDCEGADIVLHGHAHRGTEHGVTPGGIPVRNVAQPVINRPYRVFVFGGDGDGSREPAHAGEAAS